MRKWRFPIALCLTQTAVTAVLTMWADRVDWLLGDSNRIPPTFLRVHMLVIELRRVWRGVNAPTLPSFALNVFFIFLILHVVGWLVSNHINRLALQLKPPQAA